MRIRLSFVAVVVVVSSVAGGLVNSPTADALASSDVVATAGSGVASAAQDSRPDLTSAHLAARLLKRRVEVSGLETETTTTFANPDGSLTTEASSSPVREQVAGVWRPVDTTLVAVPGGFAPRVSALPVVFSGGDGAVLDRVKLSGKGVSVGWPGPLPAPTVAGNTATYHDVEPGVDLVLTAGVTGYESSIVLTRRPSAAVAFTLPIVTSGLSVAQDTSGALRYTDPGGRVALVSNQPVMWGAAFDPAADEPARVSPVSSTLTRGLAGVALTVRPSAAFLADPAVTYPVTIDPPSSLASAHYMYISSADPAVSHLDNNTTDQGVTGITKVGTWDGGPDTDRAFYQFSTSAIAGASVVSASMSFHEFWSYSCTPEEVDLYTAANFTSANSWNSPPAAYGEFGALRAAHGYSSSCPADLVTFTPSTPGSSGNLTTLAQQWATNAADGTQNHQLASVELRSPDEVDDSYWKKFAGNGATLSITYNSTPSVVAGRSTSPCAYTCTNGAGTQLYTNSTTPAFYGQSSDPNGNYVDLFFEVWAGAAASPTTEVASGSTGYVPSGTEASWQVGAGQLSNGTGYEWRARAYNGTNYSGWSTWTWFTVDTTPPDPPSLTSTFPSLGTATSGSFSWSDTSSDVAASGYELDDQPISVVVASSGTASYSGLLSGQHEFSVVAEDLAGNDAESDYYFAIGDGYLLSPLDQARTQRFVNLGAVTPSGYSYTWFEDRVGSTGAFAPITLPSSGASPVTNSGANVYSWPVSSGSSLLWDVSASVPSDGLVQVEACFGTSAASASICTPISSVQLTTHAFAESDATKQVGPGTVALLTGDYAVPATDVSVPSYLGSLTLGRTFTTLTPSAYAGTAGVFGPGWRAAFYGPNAGHADAALEDNSAKGYVTLVDPDGTEELYNSSGGNTYTGQNDTAAQGSVLTKNSATQYTLTEKDGTQTVYSQTSADVWGTTAVIQDSNTTAATTTSYTLDSAGRVTQILAPVPSGVSCASPTTTPGCRTLQFSYATTTTASGSALGDYAGQLKAVSFTSYDPATSEMTTVAVADYAYDVSGHLRQEWDPRISPSLVTSYSYDANGRLSTLTPPGLAGWSFGYSTSSTTNGWLSSVSHPDTSGATATSTVVYGIPVDATGPVDLSKAAVAAWGETSSWPVTAAAVFTPDHVPSSSPSASDWPYAQITYMDVNGRPVNTAAYGNGGWLYDAEQYDGFGNNVLSISPGNVAQAITPTSATDPAVQAPSVSEISRAKDLATISTYSTDGTELLTTMGPTHPIHTAAGTLIDGRQSVTNTYDEGAPSSGGPYRLLTTSVSGAKTLSGTSYDAVTTHTGYGALVAGDTTGWVLHKPTSVTTVMASGSNLVSSTRYNPVGQVIESRLPAGAVNSSGAGDDAYTTDSTYYTASGTGACVSAALAGLVCAVGPAAQPSSGKPLPVTTTTYNVYDEPVVVSETAGSVVRTTTTGYDAAGREISSGVAVSPTGADGAATPAQAFAYDPAKGLPTTTSDSTGHTLTTSYDSLGRVHTYTDATGATTTTAYDIDGRPISVTDPKGTTSYTYDGVAGEHRGLVTSETDSLAGSFTGTYDDDGHLATQVYPGGLTATYAFDNAGSPIDISYAESGVTWLDFSATRDSQSRIASSNDASGTTTSYSYDNAGRLTSATDDTGTACASRAYGFNADSDRTSLGSSSYAATSGGCVGSGTPMTITHSYDQADRITDAGYSYDDFGRTLTVPSIDAGGQGDLSIGYYTNDLVRAISGTVDGVATTKAFGLDPAGRVLTETTTGPATVPDAPTGVTAAAGDGQATVSWVASASDGGAAITGYTVTASPGGATATTSGATSATVTGLTDGTAYTFTVTATNSVGVSPASVSSGAVTPTVVGGGGGSGISFVQVAGSAALSNKPSIWTSLSSSVADGDVLLAVNADSKAGSVTWTPPDSWPAVADADVESGTSSSSNLRAALSHKVAAGDAGVGDEWDSSAWANLVLGVVEYSGVDTTTPFDVAPTTAANTLSAPDLTTVSAGDELVDIVVVSGADNTVTAPVGFTQRFDMSTSSGTADPHVYVFDATQAAAGATGVVTASASGSASNAVVILAALRPAGGGEQAGQLVLPAVGRLAAAPGVAGLRAADAAAGGSVSFVGVAGSGAVNNKNAVSAVLSSSVADGDVLVSVLADSKAGSVTWSSPPGWSATGDGDVISGTTSSSNMQAGLGHLVASGVAGATAWWDSSVWANEVAGVLEFAGVDAVTPLDGVVSTAANTVTAPSLSTSSDGDELVYVVVLGSAGEVVTAPPAGFTQVFELASSSGSADPHVYVFDATQATAGATGVVAASISDDATNAVVMLAALRPASGSGGATVPDAPTAVTASPGDGQAMVSWVAPVSDGGSPVTGYMVTASPGGQTVSVGGSTTSAVVTGLTNGTAYSFTVTATNAVGAGAVSVASGSVTPVVAGSGVVVTDHYGGGSDAPSWTSSSDGSWVRHVIGLDGGMDATVTYDPGSGTTSTLLQLLDLHGDVAATANPAGTGLSATYSYDEFGNPTDTNAMTYGWLGGKTRPQTGIGGLILMGARVYDPATGRFLQTDPIPGGSCNPYDYTCQNPINKLDLAGLSQVNDPTGDSDPAYLRALPLSAKKVSTSEANRIARALGYKDAHDLKDGWGDSKVDIYKVGDDIYIRAKGDRGEGEWIGRLPSGSNVDGPASGTGEGEDDLPCACGDGAKPGVGDMGRGFFGEGDGFLDFII